MSSWADGLRLLTSMNLSTETQSSSSPTGFVRGSAKRRSVVQFFSSLRTNSQQGPG